MGKLEQLVNIVRMVSMYYSTLGEPKNPEGMTFIVCFTVIYW